MGRISTPASVWRRCSSTTGQAYPRRRGPTGYARRAVGETTTLWGEDWPDVRALWCHDLHPLVTSDGAGRGLHEEFDWTGTDDPTPWLAAPAALDLMARLGWDRVRTHNQRLALLGRDLVAEALGTTPPVPDAATGPVAIVPMPTRTVRTQEEAWALGWRLFDEHRIEGPVTWWNNRAFVRISAHVYNPPAE